MTKTISRDDFADLMADAAMKMPLTRKRKSSDPKNEFIDEFDHDALSNEWANAVQCLRDVGVRGVRNVPTPEGGFKQVPMRTMKDMPKHIVETVKEAMATLKVEHIVN